MAEKNQSKNVAAKNKADAACPSGCNEKNTRNTAERVVARESQILPAGTPKSKKERACNDVQDPPVPNRAHTEMKLSKGENKVP